MMKIILHGGIARSGKSKDPQRPSFFLVDSQRQSSNLRIGYKKLDIVVREYAIFVSRWRK
jgi:hypothetical protein